MAKGGARPGAGRPKGSVTRPQLRNYFDEAETAARGRLKERAKTDSTILKFLGEQVFGKAPQPLTGEDGEPLAVAGFTLISNSEIRPTIRPTVKQDAAWQKLLDDGTASSCLEA